MKSARSGSRQRASSTAELARGRSGDGPVFDARRRAGRRNRETSPPGLGDRLDGPRAAFYRLNAPEQGQDDRVTRLGRVAGARARRCAHGRRPAAARRPFGLPGVFTAARTNNGGLSVSPFLRRAAQSKTKARHSECLLLRVPRYVFRGRPPSRAVKGGGPQSSQSLASSRAGARAGCSRRRPCC
jgi:hypothetical protein